MNYSNPDYGSVGQQDSYRNMPQQQEPYYEQQPLILTLEEKRVLQECSREGIFQRGIPMGLAFGLAGMYGAKAGPLMSSKFGVKPAVIGLGALGYFLGRFSYSKVCMQRVLEVPDGNLRKIMIQKGVLPSRENMEQPYDRQDPSNFYANIDVPNPDRDRTWDTKRRVNSDIELPSTSSFDTVPSEYYTEVDVEAQPADEVRPKSYTSYDDLRKSNRQEFNNRVYPEHSQRYASPDFPHVRRPRVPETPPVIPTGSQQTKYGDLWE